MTLPMLAAGVGLASLAGIPWDALSQ